MALSPGTHGVIVIHGIGDKMNQGDILAEFTKYLCDTLMDSQEKDVQGKKTLPKIGLKSDMSADPPSVTLTITSPNGKESAAWLCKEAFWGDAFPPPKATQVLWWALNQNLKKQLFALVSIFQDPATEKSYLPDDEERKKEEDKLKEKSGNRQANQGIESFTLEKNFGAKFRAKTSLTSLGLIPLTVLTYLILSLMWIFHFVPAIGPLEGVINWIRKFDPFLSNSLGDVERYIQHEVWSANARARLEKVLIAMLNDQFGEVKDITIIAHSMGCVVTYDALAEDGAIAAEVTRLETLGKRKKITFVSVGSGINRVFQMASSNKPPKSTEIYSRMQFERALAKAITGYDEVTRRGDQNKFFWLDIFARRDPVPAGALEQRIVKQAKVDSYRQVKRRQVINEDNVFLDHSSYWKNIDLVMPRIARAINGGTDYPWPEVGITKEKVSRHIERVAGFSKYTKIVLGIILAGILVLIGLKLAGII
jgi:hypothetical protein